MRLRVVAVLLLAASCTGDDVANTPSGGATVTQAAAKPRLLDRQPCGEPAGFDCATLRVPLDHSGATPGTLDLAVALAPNDDAPQGVLLALAGGPGQGGVDLIERVSSDYYSSEVLAGYQLVMFDERGTGSDAIDCPELQSDVGGSDYLTPDREATIACAEQLGEARQFYSTDDVVADIELLRQALGVDTMVVDGVSYGTFVGEHYALSHPDHVSHLVLDSPVPQDGFEPFVTASMAATAEVLRDACADENCATDPAADLAWVIRNTDIDGPSLVDALSVMSLTFVDPTFNGVPQLLAQARAGDTGPLEQFLDSYSAVGLGAKELSAGLHMATLCTDLRFPWGDSAAPLAGREDSVRQAVARIPAERIWPYDRDTAASVLPIEGCIVWPPTEPTRYAAERKIKVPTLVLSGERDLFCPVAWGHEQVAQTTQGRLIVFPDVGHGTQRAPDPAARDAVTDFLLPG